MVIGSYVLVNVQIWGCLASSALFVHSYANYGNYANNQVNRGQRRR